MIVNSGRGLKDGASTSAIACTCRPPHPLPPGFWKSLTFSVGSNAEGQLGDGTTVDGYLPVTLALEFSMFAWAGLAAGFYHQCGYLADGRGFCW